MSIHRYALFSVLLAICSASYALEPSNPNVTLVPPPPPATKLLGIPFGENPLVAADAFAVLGEPKQTPLGPKNTSISRLYQFSGSPPTLPAAGGQTRVLFFKNKLIRTDILFPPSYANFLLVRKALFESFDDRFRIGKRREMMDPLLKMHLAQLQPGEYSEETEATITDTLLTRKTFYFYSIDDSQGEFHIMFSYHAATKENGETVPRLLLHISLKQPMEEFQAYQKAEKSRSEGAR